MEFITGTIITSIFWQIVIMYITKIHAIHLQETNEIWRNAFNEMQEMYINHVARTLD